MDNFKKQVQLIAEKFKAANVELFEDGAILHCPNDNVVTIAYYAWCDQAWVRMMTNKVFAQMAEDANSAKARMSLPVFAHIYDYGLSSRHRVNRFSRTNVQLVVDSFDCICLNLNGSESDVKAALKEAVPESTYEEHYRRYQRMNKVGHPDREYLFAVEQDCDDCLGAVFTDYLSARDAIMARHDAEDWRIRPMVLNKFCW